jgi:cytidine deaminase
MTERESLLAAAAATMANAHAPYSKFRVGAAVRAADGRIFAGCNVENASYGLTICAERAAVFAAVAAGAKRIDAVAIVASGPHPPFPCGACRQVLAEFAAPDTPVWLRSARRGARTLGRRLGALLPDAFEFSRAHKSARGRGSL